MQFISHVSHEEECQCEPCWRKECRCDICRCEPCQCEDECRRSVRLSLSSSLNKLCMTASLGILGDEILSCYLYICLQIALTHDWDLDPYELRLLELCRLNHSELGDLERSFYHDGGGDKAVLALYRETLNDKKFFTFFDTLSPVAQENLIHQTKGLIIDKALVSRVDELRQKPTLNAILLKYTKIPRKPRAQNQSRPAREPLQRVKTEGIDPAQIPGGNNDNTSVVKRCAQHHGPCQKKPPKVYPSSLKRKRSLEEKDNLKSDSTQLPANTQAHHQLLPPTASQLPVGKAIVVQDHDRTATSQPRTDHNQSLVLTDYSTPSSIASHLNPASVDPRIEPEEIDTQNHGVALREHPEQLTSNQTSHGDFDFAWPKFFPEDVNFYVGDVDSDGLALAFDMGESL